MAEPFLSEVRLFAFLFAPRGWAFCNGQTLPINQNVALFSLLGTTYGGNGTTNFLLPNLQGRVITGWGSGSGLTPNILGQVGGQESATVTLAAMPQHAHTVVPSVANDTDNTLPEGTVPGMNGSVAYGAPTEGAFGAAFNSGESGEGIPFSVTDPCCTLNYCFALSGIFPSRT